MGGGVAMAMFSPQYHGIKMCEIFKDGGNDVFLFSPGFGL